MKIKLVLFIALLPILSFAQKRTTEAPPVEPIYNPFGKRFKFSFSTRLKNYPFNIAAQVQVVSFEAQGYQATADTKFYNNTPKLDKSNWTSPFIETRVLNFLEVDKLTDILYNYGHQPGSYFSEQASCFMPRNAILFLDKDGEIFDYIEICFECQRIQTYNNRIQLPHDCEHKIKMLSTFFKMIGIKQGVTQ